MNILAETQRLIDEARRVYAGTAHRPMLAAQADGKARNDRDNRHQRKARLAQFEEREPPGRRPRTGASAVGDRRLGVWQAGVGDGQDLGHLTSAERDWEQRNREARPKVRASSVKRPHS